LSRILERAEDWLPVTDSPISLQQSYVPRATRWDLIALGVPLVSLSALLYMQGMFLWSKQHLQFFPLAIAASFYFLLSESDDSVPVAKNRQRLSKYLLVAVLCCVVLSSALYSSWLSHATAIFSVFVWALGRFGSIRFLRLLGIVGLLAITVPIPFGGDRALIAWLQDASSFACCSMMDVLRIIHLRSGNVIEIAEKPLFVEEACSGVDSQYALMAVAGVLLLIGRASFLVSLATIITVPIWAILGNILRILAIVLGLEFAGIDLSVGTKHMLLGLMCFSLAAWAHWSSVQFLNFLECWFRGDRIGPQTNTVASETESGVLCDFLRGKLWVLCLAPLLFAPISWFIVLGGRVLVALPVITDEVVRGFPAENPQFLSLSGHLGSATGNRYLESVRNRDDFLGQRSRSWAFSTPEGASIVSLDMPFRGFHELWECYLRTGWLIDHKTTVNAVDYRDGGSWPIYEVTLRNKVGDNAILHFSYFDRDGVPYLRERTREFRGQRDRRYRTILQEVVSIADKLQGDREPLTFQLQMITSSKNTHSEEQILELRERYSQMRRRFLLEMNPALRGLPDSFR
jgi:exosortase